MAINIKQPLKRAQLYIVYFQLSNDTPWVLHGFLADMHWVGSKDTCVGVNVEA